MDTIWIFRWPCQNCFWHRRHSHLADNWLRSIIPDHQIRSLQRTNPKVGINYCEQLGILLNCVEYICLSSQQDHKYPFRVLYCFKIICLGMTVVAFSLSTNCSAMEGILVVSCAFVNLLIPASIHLLHWLQPFRLMQALRSGAICLLIWGKGGGGF